MKFARKHMVIVILSAAVISGCSGPQTGGFAFPPVPVETAVVTTSTIEDRFEAVGSIEAQNAITIVSEIDAIVTDLPFHEGTTIQKGALVAQLDDSQIRAEMARAAALLEQKEANFERIQTLFEKGVTTQQDFDDASAAFKVAQADLAIIEARLAKTRITAPFSGVIGARTVSPGAFLRAGTAITSLTQLSELKVTFSAPERFFALLRRGSEVTISTTAYPDEFLKGKIEVIEPIIDQATRAALMIAHFENPEDKFRPGMSANISAVMSRREKALVIPDEAVFAEGAQNMVYVVKEDSSVARAVITVGTRQRKAVEVVQGLEAGMTIVKAGHQKLFDGAKVNPLPSAGDSGQWGMANGGGR